MNSSVEFLVGEKDLRQRAPLDCQILVGTPRRNYPRLANPDSAITTSVTSHSQLTLVFARKMPFSDSRSPARHAREPCWQGLPSGWRGWELIWHARDRGYLVRDVIWSARGTDMCAQGGPP